jgi:DnaJ-class molecular chaperone
MNHYYQILDLQPNCAREDIKKAFRKLSLKFHPDKDSTIDSGKYLLIKEAYEALMRTEDSQSMTTAAVAPSPPPPHSMNPLPPPHISVSLSVEMKTCYEGGKKPINIDRWYIEGCEKRFESVTLYVDIYEGIDDNELIILKGQGNVVDNILRSDVKIFIKIENNSEFQRKGLDLIYTKRLTLKEALCGFQFDLTLLNGKMYTINNKRGNIISPGFKKTLHGLGLVRGNSKGSLMIVFEVGFPTYLSDKNINHLENIL